MREVWVGRVGCARDVSMGKYNCSNSELQASLIYNPTNQPGGNETAIRKCYNLDSVKPLLFWLLFLHNNASRYWSAY